MSECHVYVSHWRRTKDGFEGWLERWPKRRVTGKTFHEMTEALGDVVGEQVGDGEPQFEFEPPYIEAAGWKHLFRDGWTDTFFLHALRLDGHNGIFTGGFCGRCKRPIGGRTATRFEVEWGDWAEGITAFATSANDTMRIPVLSEELLDVLTREERASFDLRPVATRPSSGTRFFELAPRQFVAEAAGKALKARGWRCPACGRRQIHNEALGYGPKVVSRDSLPPGPGLLFLGDPGAFSLCFTAQRWEAVKARLRQADITSSPLAIIEPHDRDDSVVLQE
jgi:hypothetical protein